MPSFECARCLQCCKRYFITLLPGEAKKQARLLNRSTTDFLQSNTQLLLQVFPAKSASHPWIKRRSELFFGDKLPSTPDFDFVFLIPNIAIKRAENGSCLFLNEEKKTCGVYAARPGQCHLFPLIAKSKSYVTAKDYPFCVGLQQSQKSPVSRSQNDRHYARVKKHLDALQQKGFQTVWKSWPKEGVVVWEEKVLAPINQESLIALNGI